MILNVISVVLLGLIVLLVIAIIKFLRSKQRRTRQKETDGRFAVAFFHPYCNAGGGGERVLWCGIRTLQQRFPSYRYVVYTGDVDASPMQILENVKSRFNISLDPHSVEFIFLKQRDWVEAHHYPHLTLLRQSLGSVVLGLEALHKFVPDLYIDTMGYAFTLPIFKLIGQCHVAAYVHYPTISTDMLERVSSGTQAHNNNPMVASSRFLTTLKIFYYRLFAWAYSRAGQHTDAVMVNSSWTQSHINSLWHCPSKISKVFPPCNVEDFRRIPLDERRAQSLIKIVSVAQFRPEKDHLLQLTTMVELRKIVNPNEWEKIRLILVGSCRNIDDNCRVAHLKYMCAQMDLKDNVEFMLNVSYEDLKSHMAEGMIGIHTMWNEHFGIGVVECMAAGLIMVAHKSGGPMMDIVETLGPLPSGFLASTAEEYAQKIQEIIHMEPSKRRKIQINARSSLDRFSDDAFSTNFFNSLKQILQQS